MRLPWAQNRRCRERARVRTALCGGAAAIARVIHRMLPPLIILGLLGAAAWSIHGFITTTPYFRLRSTDITGLSRLGREELTRWAGLGSHTHVLTLDLQALERRLKAHEWVSDAHVERVLPGQLRIRISERQPAALLLLDGLFLVDEHGVGFAGSEGLAEERLPIISGLDRPALLAEPEEMRLKVVAALAVIREWARQRLPEVARLSELHMDPSLGMILFTEEGSVRVHLGWKDHPMRLARLKRVIEALKAEGKRPDYVLLDDEIRAQRVTVGLLEQTRGATSTPG